MIRKMTLVLLAGLTLVIGTAGSSIAQPGKGMRKMEGGGGKAMRAKAQMVEKCSPCVKEIQKALKKAGYDPGPIDGFVGPNTRGAVRDFQKAKGLKPDGRVEKKTLRALMPFGMKTMEAMQMKA